MSTNVVHILPIVGLVPDYPYIEVPMLAGEDIQEGNRVMIRNIPGINGLNPPDKQPYGTIYATDLTFDGSRLVCGSDTRPYLYTYTWNGSQYKICPLNAEDIPANGIHATALTSDGQYLFIGLHSAPWVQIYEWNTDRYVKSTRSYNIPPKEDIGSITCLPDGSKLVICGHLNPNIYTYMLNGNVYERQPNPDVSPIVAAYAVDMNSTGDRLAIGTRQYPFSYVYDWDGTRWIKQLDISPLTQGRVLDVWFDDNDKLYIGQDQAPYLVSYVYAGATNQYTIERIPPMEPDLGVKSVVTTPDGSVVVGGLLTKDWLKVYYNINGFYSVGVMPPMNQLPWQGVRTVEITRAGDRIVVGAYSPQFLMIYQGTSTTIWNYTALEDLDEWTGLGFASENISSGTSGLVKIYFQRS